MSRPDSHIRLCLRRADFSLEVDLRLPGTGITVVFGPSGCGKTSLLRCVAGLELLPDARVSIAGETWQDAATGICLPTWRRPLGYVFQEASLFEHLDVRANLQFGLKRSGLGRDAAGLDAAIELLGIGALLRRRPDQLSGGERQRVAIARALATQPKLLLLDEPLAAIDHARRQEILPWLERLRDELHMPMLYVTHASDEVVRLAQTLVVLEAGRVKACGPVGAVLAGLDGPGVMGEDAGALLEAVVHERDLQWHLASLAFPGGTLWVRDTGLALGRRVRVRLLARDVSIATEKPSHTSIQNLLACVVQAVEPDTYPAQALVRLKCGDAVLLARLTARAVNALGLIQGQQVWAQVKSVALVG